MLRKSLIRSPIDVKYNVLPIDNDVNKVYHYDVHNDTKEMIHHVREYDNTQSLKSPPDGERDKH